MIKDVLKGAAPGAFVLLIAGYSGIVWAQESAPPPTTAIEQTEKVKVKSEKGAAASQTMPVSFTFSAVKVPGGALSVTGQVPSEATIRFLRSQRGVVVDRLAVTTDAPVGFDEQLRQSITALMELEQGRISFDKQGWVLTGEIGSAAAKERLAEDFPDVAMELSVVASLDECRAQLAELTSHNAILFRSGSAIIADSARGELDRFAAVMSECGNAVFEVEGHTDADGDDRANLVLSINRAEAVVKALVARGINEARFYAIGYGEAVPVASNDTPAGKAANRRIVIKIRD